MSKWIFILVISPLITFAQSKKTFLITGSLKSVSEGSQVVLLGFNGKDTLAKSTVQHGIFTLSGVVDNTDARIILFPDLQRRLVLFIGGDTVSITGASEFSDVTISGSKSNLDYEEFMYDIKPL